MQPNPMRDHFSNGTVALGGWASMPSPISTEVLAQCGLDYVCIDMQHGLIDYSDTVSMLAALHGHTTTPVIRVPWNTPDHIGKALDAGAMGVIIPMVNSVEECRAAVNAALYAPAGGRSYGPARALPIQGSDYWERANQDVAIIPMIETVQAVDAIDDILAVDDVTAIYVGPSDLAISMGHGPGTDEPDFREALDHIVARCEAHGVVPGIHATTATAQDRLERRFRMVTITADLVALRTKLADDVALVRSGATGTTTSTY